MKTTIEIKETNLKTLDLYNINSYNESGIYLNTDEFGNSVYVASIIKDGFVLHIGTKSQFEYIFEKNIKPDTVESELIEYPEQLEEIEQVVSESFALKMVAIVLNKEKFNDLL